MINACVQKSPFCFLVKLIASILICLNFEVATAQTLQPIDSVFLNTLVEFSANAERMKNEVWPGMKIGPFCLFRLNGPAFIMNHPQPPANTKQLADSIYMTHQADLALMGTSQTEINHFLTAHNNYAQPFYVSVNQVYSELFHELHHVYQRTHIKKLQFDNPAELLTYPEDYKNDAVKQYENELLLEMLSGTPSRFQDNLNQFYSCRLLRKNIIGEKYMNYERRVESAEGPSTYCEYMYMKAFASTVAEHEYINKRFFYALAEPTYGREGLRNKHLLTGMAQCILLSKAFKGWQPDYYSSGLTLNEYFFTKFVPTQVALPSLHYYEAKAQYFTVLEKQKHAEHLDAFNHQSGVKVTLIFNQFPEFRGFDPMHAESISDSLILHTTLLKFGRGANHFSMANQGAVTLTNGQVWFVKRVTFFIPEGAIRLSNNTLSCTNDHATISWRYVKQIKKGEEYFITLE